MMNAEFKSALEGYHNQTKELVKEAKDQIFDLQEQVENVENTINRGGFGGMSSPGKGENSEHGQAFNTFVRTGIDDGLADLEVKADLRTDSDPDGGYAVPEQIDKSIDKCLRDLSPLRTLCNVVPVGTSNYKKLVSVGGAASGWVGETTARPKTDTPQFDVVEPPLGEIYSNPAVTQKMLDDAFFDVEAFLTEELSEEFAEKEGTAFVNGDGSNKPQGFMTYPTAATIDASRAFGTLQYVPTGVADDFPATDKADILIDLITSLRAPYRKGAVWIMNSSVLAVVRKFKDNNGDYLWRAGLMEGQPSLLLGYPVHEVEDMPSIGAGAMPIAFGNFKRGYTITDHVKGVRILRDPYTNKPYVHFYTTKRVGGGVVNSQAIKLLKIATT